MFWIALAVACFLVGVLVSSLLSYFEHKRILRKEREAHCLCPDHLCPVHPEHRPVEPVGVAPHVARSDHTHGTRARSDGSTQQAFDRLYGIPNRSIDTAFSELERSMSNMETVLNGVGDLANRLGHLQEDLRDLQSLGIDAATLESTGHTERFPCLHELRRRGNIPDAQIRSMVIAVDHNNIPNWVPAICALMRGSDQLNDGLLSAYYASFEREETRDSTPEDKKDKTLPSRFDREDVV